MDKGADVLFPQMKVTELWNQLLKASRLPESTGVNDHIFIATL